MGGKGVEGRGWRAEVGNWCEGDVRAGTANGGRCFARSPSILQVLAVVSIAAAPVVCDQVHQVDQVIPKHKVGDIDEVHGLDSARQVDHKDVR